MYTQDELKDIVAKRAVAEFVKSGMVVGLGTGSTASFVVYELGRKLKTGELTNVIGVPTSERTRELAIEHGIPLLQELPEKLDLTIDGADRINLVTGDCIKGWGGAHYIEKRIANLGSRMIVIVDESKLSEDFKGERVPLEVESNCLHLLCDALNSSELKFSVRDFISDSGNNVVDVIFDGEVSLLDFHKKMCGMPGVLDSGVFTGIVTNVLVSKNEGDVDMYNFK